MADYARLPGIVGALRLQEWNDRFAQIVARLLGPNLGAGIMLATAARRTATRSFTPPATPPAAADTESKIVPPTRTEDPDSIVGGRPTTEFPDCCAVGDASQYFCTGTLIAPNLVVTAEHCTGATQVFLRGQDIAIPADGETLAVAQDIGHPTADLRVLVLETDSSVTPRHVAQGAEVDASSCTLAGFGTIDFGGTVGYGIKRRVDVPVTSIACEAQGADTTFGCVRGIEMVAGQRGLALDSCRGDSGGPLYIQSPEGEVFLLGATSRGVNNADTLCGDGGIYVRVDQFVDWIAAETGVTIPGPIF